MHPTSSSKIWFCIYAGMEARRGFWGLEELESHAVVSCWMWVLRKQTWVLSKSRKSPCLLSPLSRPLWLRFQSHVSLYRRNLRHFFKITGACIEIQPGLDINSVLPLCPMTSQNKITGSSLEAPGSRVFYTCKVDLAPDVRTSAVSLPAENLIFTV